MAYNRRQGNRYAKLTSSNARFAAAEARDGDGQSLTSLLRRQLFDVNLNGKVWAQRLVEAWIDEAIDGNFRALQEILIRIDGEAKAREPIETAVTERLAGHVDERTSRTLLDAIEELH